MRRIPIAVLIVAFLGLACSKPKPADSTNAAATPVRSDSTGTDTTPKTRISDSTGTDTTPAALKKDTTRPKKSK